MAWPASPTAGLSNASQPQAPSVLVVDDEPANREVLTRFLTDEGFQVVTAASGAEALERVAANPPDLVLLDVMMPGPDGFEVCRRLKNDPATGFIPIVIVTALSGKDERLLGVRVGADEFLSKPFDHVELITRARALLRTKRYFDELRASNQALEQRVHARTVELRLALDDLQELGRLKSEFIANVSHELRTPLLHVKGYVDLLSQGALGPVTPMQAEGLAVAQEALERLERVVEDVVDFSNLHEAQLALELLYLPDVCRHALHAAQSVAARRGIEIELNLAPNLPPVRADRVALVRVLRHLLDNAIKFGPPGQPVRLSASLNQGRVRLSVFDQGHGLTQEEIRLIFDVFYQVDGSITRRAGGLGVGLALVNKLVAAHGAVIRVDSQPGQGSCFYFELEPA